MRFSRFPFFVSINNSAAVSRLRCTPSYVKSPSTSRHHDSPPGNFHQPSTFESVGAEATLKALLQRGCNPASIIYLIVNKLLSLSLSAVTQILQSLFEARPQKLQPPFFRGSLCFCVLASFSATRDSISSIFALMRACFSLASASFDTLLIACQHPLLDCSTDQNEHVHARAHTHFLPRRQPASA